MAAVSRGGIAYAALWCAVAGLRLAFAYQTEHGWKASFFTWLVRHHIPPAAYAGGMIFMALAMTLTRTVYLAVQRHRRRQPTGMAFRSPQNATHRPGARSGAGRAAAAQPHRFALLGPAPRAAAERQ